MFTSSSEVFEWLSKFINLERGQIPKSFRLDRMEFLAQLAENPHRCVPSIHIAGSKGKGSVTAMLTAMLNSAGYRTARYMSPHVIDIRERICLGDSYFSEDIYCTAGDKLRQVAEVLLPKAINAALSQKASAQIQKALLFAPSTDEGCEPTYFELLTLLFFLCAKLGNCDVMVVETGMGGRLDSTNILDPIVSVITLIELEHTAFLGNTKAKIAGEKAGIIKQGKPVILAKQCNEALEVFIKTAQKKNSPFVYFPDTAKLSNFNITPCGTKFNLNILTASAVKNFSYSIPIPGKVQAENAALAIVALKTAFPNITDNVIRRALENFQLPGRFEKIAGSGKTPPFIIDGAHTPESLELCVETFCSLYGKGGVLLFGCAADKDAAAMARIVQSQFAKIFITTVGTFKVNNPVDVYETFVKITGAQKTQLAADTEKAVRLAQECKLPILGTGSFYLVSEIRKIVSGS